MSLTLTHSILYHTPQESGNGNISIFKDGDEFNVQDSALVDQVSALLYLTLLFVLNIVSYSSLLGSYL